MNKKLKELGYSVSKEYSGNKGKYFVLRFRGEYLSAHATKKEAVHRADILYILQNYKTGQKVKTFEGLSGSILTINTDMGFKPFVIMLENCTIQYYLEKQIEII